MNRAQQTDQVLTTAQMLMALEEVKGMQRAQAIKIRKALDLARIAMEEGGMDTYALRAEIERVELRINHPKDERVSRSWAYEPPPPETSIDPEVALLAQRKRNMDSAYTSPGQQLAYERATRILSVAAETVASDLLKRYDYYETRFALHGALNYIAGGVNAMLHRIQNPFVKEGEDGQTVTRTAR